METGSNIAVWLGVGAAIFLMFVVVGIVAWWSRREAGNKEE